MVRNFLVGPLALLLATAASAQPVPSPESRPILPYEAISPRSPEGDRLVLPRRIAAAVVAQSSAEPKLIVDVGSYTGEFLEAFLEQFPAAKGQWTEPVENNRVSAQRRFARFGGRASYVIGCPARDISLGCIPAGTDVLITSWITIHQNLDGIRKFHREAFARLPSNGWIAVIDHVGAGEMWDARLAAARKGLADRGLVGPGEGPPIHHAELKVPALEEQIDAFRAAGFVEIKVVWRQLDTVLIMARKP